MFRRKRKSNRTRRKDIFREKERERNKTRREEDKKTRASPRRHGPGTFDHSGLRERERETRKEKRERIGRNVL